MSNPVQFGKALSIETPAQGRRRVRGSAVHVQTVTDWRNPLTRRPIAQGEAGVAALPACAGRLLLTP
jgi:hypothetical protein